MKKMTITQDDYIKAHRKASREEEIAQHGKQIAHRGSVCKSKKVYNRKSEKAALKKLPFDLYMRHCPKDCVNENYLSFEIQVVLIL